MQQHSSWGSWSYRYFYDVGKLMPLKYLKLFLGEHVFIISFIFRMVILVHYFINLFTSIEIRNTL